MTTAARLAKLERNAPQFHGVCGGKADVYFHDHPIPTDLPVCRRCGVSHVVVVQVEEVVVDVADVHGVERAEHVEGIAV